MMDRLAMLEKMVAARPDDPFPAYGLAMELRKLGRLDDARARFEALVERHPDYVPTYLMFGNLLVQMNDRPMAADVLDRGISAASRAGDSHALGELRAARAELP